MDTTKTAVTALMVTSGEPLRRVLALLAIKSWQEQTYTGPMQMLILNHGTTPVLSQPVPGITEELVPRPPTLGDLRNQTLDRVQTPYAVVWDDDDYSHPARLTYQVARTPQGGASVFAWELGLDLWTGSCVVKGWQRHFRGWPNTLLFPTDTPIRYPSQDMREDTEFVISLFAHRVLFARLDAPAHYYLRTYHGANTCSRSHILPDKIELSRKITPAEAAYVAEMWRGPYAVVRKVLPKYADSSSG